jgi:hypothetical protein
LFIAFPRPFLGFLAGEAAMVIHLVARIKMGEGQSRGHSGAMRSIEPGISRFRDAQLRIWGLVLRTIPE